MRTVIAIPTEAARTLTVKGFHWALSFIDEVTEVCTNSNLFRKASLPKPPLPPADSSDDLAPASSCSVLHVLSFLLLNQICFLNLCMLPPVLHYIL